MHLADSGLRQRPLEPHQPLANLLKPPLQDSAQDLGQPLPADLGPEQLHSVKRHPSQHRALEAGLPAPLDLEQPASDLLQRLVLDRLRAGLALNQVDSA